MGVIYSEAALELYLDKFYSMLTTPFVPRVCSLPSKFQKIYKISRHIESLDGYMEH
jgi:hypothetical protein